MNTDIRGAALVAALTMLTACGGGNPGPPTYTVGGTVTGLSGPGLVLQNEGGADLPISASGAFTFATRMPSGTSYAVTVKNSPTSPLQICTVADGVGTIAATDVTNVSITCKSGYTVGGTVSGLQGSGLVLQLRRPLNCGYDGCRGASPNVGRPLQITLNGPFTFKTVLPANTAGWSVLVTQQPASPTQLCVTRNAGIGTQGAAVADVEVVCSQFSYVANATDNTVSAYTIDATSGALAAVGTPVATGTSPHAIVGTQDKKYVFVGNEGSNDISAFAVNSASGALTAVPGSPFPVGTGPKALALYQGSGNNYLYVANTGSDTVSAFAVDASSGALTPLSPATFATGKSPSSIEVDANLGIIYVANNGGSNDVSAFSVDTFTGLLTPLAGSPFPAGANPLSLALGAAQDGTQPPFLYTANPDATNPSISGFSIISGPPTRLSGSPFPLAVSHDIATDRTGAYLYVTAGNGVVGYGINRTTGMLTPLAGFPVITGTAAHSVTFDTTNQFLYVANDGSADVSGFRFDATTGGLTPMTGSPFPAGNQPDFVTVF
jgi:6-phosphogluconolactonase (cycloisomerase 2 family)